MTDSNLDSQTEIQMMMDYKMVILTVIEREKQKEMQNLVLLQAHYGQIYPMIGTVQFVRSEKRTSAC